MPGNWWRGIQSRNYGAVVPDGTSEPPPDPGDGTVQFKSTQKVAVKISRVLLTALIGTVKVAVRVAQSPFSLTFIQKVGARVSEYVTGTGQVTQRPALRVTTVNTGTAEKPVVKPALNIDDRNSGTVKPFQRPALRITDRNSGTAAKPQVKPAPRITDRNSGVALKPQNKPAGNITELFFDLMHQSGGNAVTQENGCSGRQDWASTGNATGVNNGVSATLQGSAVGARDGILVLNYANFANKSELVIDSVILQFYCSQNNTTLNNGNHDHRWRKNGGAWTVLQTFTADHSGAPTSHDITASITSWTDLDTLEVGCRACYDLGEATLTSTVDAVVVDIEAHKYEVV